MARMTVCDHCHVIIDEDTEAVVSMVIGRETIRADLCPRCSSQMVSWMLGFENNLKETEGDDEEA